LQIFDVSKFLSFKEIFSFEADLGTTPLNLLQPNIEMAFNPKRRLLVGVPDIKTAYHVFLVPEPNSYPQDTPKKIKRCRYPEGYFFDPIRESTTLPRFSVLID
jgi:hypothetical protein